MSHPNDFAYTRHIPITPHGYHASIRRDVSTKESKPWDHIAVRESTYQNKTTWVVFVWGWRCGIYKTKAGQERAVRRYALEKGHWMLEQRRARNAMLEMVKRDIAMETAMDDNV